VQDACCRGKDSTRKDIRQLDLLFVHLVIRLLVLRLFACFPLLVKLLSALWPFGFFYF